MERRVTIKRTKDNKVGDTLARLAEFPEGSLISRIGNIYHSGISSTCIIGFHKETLDRCGNDHPMLLGPDFVVTQVYRPPEVGERKWQPTDEYIIDFNESYVDSSLIKKIREEIKTV